MTSTRPLHTPAPRPGRRVRRPRARLAGTLAAAGLALALAACGSDEPGSAEEAIAEAAAGDDVPEAVKDYAESLDETEVPSDWPEHETYEEYKERQRSSGDDAGSSASEPSTGSSSSRDLPAVGECLDHFPTSAEVDAGEVAVVDCAGEHAADVYAIVQMDRLGEEYPVFDELYTALTEDCGNTYLDHFGGPVVDTGIAFNFVTPSRVNWADGDTDVFCYAYPVTLDTYSGELQVTE
jgi:hypothetical protein